MLQGTRKYGTVTSLVKCDTFFLCVLYWHKIEVKLAVDLVMKYSGCNWKPMNVIQVIDTTTHDLWSEIFAKLEISELMHDI